METALTKISWGSDHPDQTKPESSLHRWTIEWPMNDLYYLYLIIILKSLPEEPQFHLHNVRCMCRHVSLRSTWDLMPPLRRMPGLPYLDTYPNPKQKESIHPLLGSRGFASPSLWSSFSLQIKIFFVWQLNLVQLLTHRQANSHWFGYNVWHMEVAIISIWGRDRLVLLYPSRIRSTFFSASFRLIVLSSTSLPLLILFYP